MISTTRMTIVRWQPNHQSVETVGAPRVIISRSIGMHIRKSIG